MAIISNAVTIADAGAFSVGLGSMTLIKTLTASSSSTLSFVHGASSVVLDGTYKEYVFKFNNIHSGNNDVLFSVGFRDGGSNYDASKVTTLFQSEHNEDDSGQVAPTMAGGGDILHNETGFQVMTRNMGSGNDECMSGELHLYDPSNTTFVKHFINRGQTEGYTNYAHGSYVAGYFNSTSAIDAVQFKFNSGNIDAGTVTLYGIV